MERIKSFLREEDGIGVVELILILVVLVGLAIIFKSQFTTLVNSLFESITDDANSI